MSIMVKGMEMPKNCKDCRFWMLFLGRYLCFAQNVEVSDYTFEFMSQNRLPNCPLVEVRPHGKLIDADELLKKVREKADFPSEEWCKAIECIENAPTVLEEEK